VRLGVALSPQAVFGINVMRAQRSTSLGCLLGLPVSLFVLWH
jgi:hypothetical protein